MHPTIPSGILYRADAMKANATPSTSIACRIRSAFRRPTVHSIAGWHEVLNLSTVECVCLLSVVSNVRG